MRSPSSNSLHYRAPVRLAALLVRDTPTAEEVVQLSFVAMHGGSQRLNDAEKALAYLRQQIMKPSCRCYGTAPVINRPAKPPPDMPSAEHGAMVALTVPRYVAALHNLPNQRRRAIVLRYYADLSEAKSRPRWDRRGAVEATPPAA